MKKHYSHHHSSSQHSIESELGGHEQLKSLLMEETAQNEFVGEKVEVAESATLIRKSGGNFLYQKLALVGLIVPGIAIFFVLVMMPSMMKVPELMCYKENALEYYPCTVERACGYPPTKFTINSKTSTVNWLYDFDLICEPDYYLTVAYYFFFAGFALGSFLLASLADYWGRKNTLLLSSILLCLLYLKFVFTKDVYGCGMLLCLIGVFAGCYYCSGVAYLTEVAAPETAVVYGVAFHVALPISGALVEGLLECVDDWKTIATVMALIPLVLIFYFTYMAESPRYLAAKEEYNEARIAANRISSCNIGHRYAWDFCPDPNERTAAHTAFSNSRNQKFLQQSIFFSYTSTKNYFASFGLLLLCIGFVLSGTVLKQQKTSYMSPLILYGVHFAVILCSGFIVRIVGHVKSIFLALAVAGIGGVIAGVMAWVHQPVQDAVVYVTQLFAVIAFVACLSLAAEACPPRIRATGFGMCAAMGIAGAICGGLILEISEDFQIVFGVVALASVFFLKWVTKLTVYAGLDDVYEVVKLYGVVKKAGEEQSEREVVGIPIRGFCVANEQKGNLGIELLRIAMNGNILGEGKDLKGEYVLGGSIKDSTKIVILKKYKNGGVEKFEGRKEKGVVKGTYEAGPVKGEFKFQFKAKLWTGELGVEKQKVEWLLIKDKHKVFGLSELDNVVAVVVGKADEEDLKLRVMGEGENLSFEGKMEESEIRGVLNGVQIELVSSET